MNKFLSFIAAAILFSGAHVSAEEFDSAGVKLHFTVHGRGEPVILIHGLFASGPINWTAPGLTAALAEHARVFVLDCRGHGASDKPAGEHDYGLAMVADVARFMDHLKLRSAHLIGYSMGAMISLKFASLHPERVRSVILGGAGWMENAGSFARLTPRNAQRPAGAIGALLAGFPEFAIPAETVKAMRVPLEIIIGENDHLRRSSVAPLLRLRPDLTEHVIPGANHLSCVIEPQFKAELQAALKRQLDMPASVTRSAPSDADSR